MITDQGMAGEFSVPVDIGLPTADPLFEFSGTLSLAINTTNQAINEQFALPALDTDGIDNDNDGIIDEADENIATDGIGQRQGRARGRSRRDHGPGPPGRPLPAAGRHGYRAETQPVQLRFRGF